jgi:peptidoglycan/LPS O-acetylase OafA/YrhL
VPLERERDVTITREPPAASGLCASTAAATGGHPVCTQPAGRADARPGRDGSIDAVRSILLAVVVVLHSLMVGVSVGAGGVELTNALENQAWFAPVSWLVQVMPLFFIVGGFASITQWRSLRAAGVSPEQYARGRIERLVRPAIALVAVVGASLATLSQLGVPAEIVATASFRIGQPLWFLGVYILCSALVPVLSRAHERARIGTVLVLLLAVTLVDFARLASGVDAVGFLNLLFVWMLVQQLGFWLADGTVDALSRRTRAGALLAALVLLTALTTGPYPADMFVNLNPPTVCLVVLGVAQLMAFSLLRPRFALLAAHPLAGRLIDALGRRSMTVYLWHLPVLIGLSALLLVGDAAFGGLLPAPLSGAWWASRPLWLICVAVAVLVVVRLFARIEVGGRRHTRAPASVRRVTLDTLLGAGGVTVALIAGFTAVPAVISLLLLGIALHGTDRFRRRATPGPANVPTHHPDRTPLRSSSRIDVP